MQVVRLFYYSVRCHGAQAKAHGEGLSKLNLEVKLLSNGGACWKKCEGPAWTNMRLGMILKCS